MEENRHSALRQNADQLTSKSRYIKRDTNQALVNANNVVGQPKNVFVSIKDFLQDLPEYEPPASRHYAILDRPSTSGSAWSPLPPKEPLLEQIWSTSRKLQPSKGYRRYNKFELNNRYFKMDPTGILRTRRGSPVPFRPRSPTPPSHVRVLRKKNWERGIFVPLDTPGGEARFVYTIQRGYKRKRQPRESFQEYYGDVMVVSDDDYYGSESDVDEARRRGKGRRNAVCNPYINVIYDSEEEQEERWSRTATSKRRKSSVKTEGRSNRGSGPNFEISPFDQQPQAASGAQSEDDGVVTSTQESNRPMHEEAVCKPRARRRSE